MSLVLPWPPAILNPNVRAHWARKADATKQYRLHCFVLAQQAKLTKPKGRAVLSLTFCPPDKRRRDDDNMLAAFKAGRDGIAQALGIDDNKLSLMIEVGEPVKGGQVKVQIMVMERVA